MKFPIIRPGACGRSGVRLCSSLSTASIGGIDAYDNQTFEHAQMDVERDIIRADESPPARDSGRSELLPGKVVLDIVVPCYNEEEALPETHRQLAVVLDGIRRSNRISPSSKICYVDDGSQDRTWNLIKELCSREAGVVGIRLSRNFGHQAALLAGLMTARGDAVVSVDADLQDDISVIPQMVDEFLAGHEVVYGVRRQRSTDTAFKRNSALLYYSLLKRLGVEIIHNHADYRLLGRRAIEALKEFTEVNLFLRGIVPLIGFNSTMVYYDRKERHAGVSKYNLRKMLRLAFDGITSFSAAPLRWVSFLGVLIFVASLGMAAWVLGIRIFTLRAVPGWASSVIPIYFLGGIQLLCLGVIGEYVAKGYIESKRRPRFLICETTPEFSAIVTAASPAARSR
jgi:glycosyltransferase involved in cell wall biosynthesis